MPLIKSRNQKRLNFTNLTIKKMTKEEINALIEEQMNKEKSKDAIEISEQANKKAKKKIDGYQVLANMGIKVPGYSPDMKVVQEKADKIMTNANEVLHTTNTGYGEELVPTDVLMADIMSVIPEYRALTSMLPGFHGAGLDKQTTRPIIGDAGLMEFGSEQTTGALTDREANRRVGTDEVTLNQKKFFSEISISDELLQFNVLSPEQLEGLVREQIARSWVRTEEALIINGDTETGVTGNVNSDDGAPTAEIYYLAANGLRKTAIVTDTNTHNAGPLTFDDFLSIINLIGDYASDPSNCLWLTNRATFNKTLGLSEFKDLSINGNLSSVNTAAITNILGSDLFIGRDMPKTEADGKVSTTPGNNTLGQYLYLWKPAVQWGYGRELRLEMKSAGHAGVTIDGWGYIGLGIVGKSQTANFDQATVGAGINITL
jgi:HK97 family phage major capsid protein